MTTKREMNYVADVLLGKVLDEMIGRWKVNKGNCRTNTEQITSKDKRTPQKNGQKMNPRSIGE